MEPTSDFDPRALAQDSAQEGAQGAASGPAPQPRAAERPLGDALRRARVENAERAQAMVDLRCAESARLDLLRERLAPIFADIPPDCDMFDVAISQGARPRLFIDMIAFVEMARDGKTYTLFQDTRRGRATLAASDRMDTITSAVADYVARRLIEREKALAADSFAPLSAAPHVERAPEPAPQPSTNDPQTMARLPRASDDAAMMETRVDARTRDADVAARARRVGESAAAAPAAPFAKRLSWRVARSLMELIGVLAALAALVVGLAWIVRHAGL